MLVQFPFWEFDPDFQTLGLGVGSQFSWPLSLTLPNAIQGYTKDKFTLVKSTKLVLLPILDNKSTSLSASASFLFQAVLPIITLIDKVLRI